jgi:hypothetical protein
MTDDAARARCGHWPLDRSCDDCWEYIQSQLGLARLALAEARREERNALQAQLAATHADILRVQTENVALLAALNGLRQAVRNYCGPDYKGGYDDLVRALAHNDAALAAEEPGG